MLVFLRVLAFLVGCFGWRSVLICWLTLREGACVLESACISCCVLGLGWESLLIFWFTLREGACVLEGACVSCWVLGLGVGFDPKNPKSKNT